MKDSTGHRPLPARSEKAISEILILADGRILAHNLSPTMAGILADLNPADEAMNLRARRKKGFKHALPN
jgi:hypothetical protein